MTAVFFMVNVVTWFSMKTSKQFGGGATLNFLEAGADCYSSAGRVTTVRLRQ